MTRPIPAQRRPVKTWMWNLLAALLSFAVLSVLYFQFTDQPLHADGDGLAIDAAGLAGGSPRGTMSSASVGASISDRPADREPTGGEAPVLTGRLALLMNLALVERGYARLSMVPDYTATFCKQERIGDELGEPQVIRIKLRHEPFSVYMKWYSGDKGRELIYVDGRNDGKLIVHVGGWKARLLPTVKLDPEGSTAMKESRHPVTDVGLLEVARRCIAYRQRDLDAAQGVRCRMLDDRRFDERDCYCFIIEYDRPELSHGYRKVVALVDKELSLPVSVKNYGWPKEPSPAADAAKLDELTLVEVYGYSDIRLTQQLTDDDFDRHNENYKFR